MSEAKMIQINIIDNGQQDDYIIKITTNSNKGIYINTIPGDKHKVIYQKKSKFVEDAEFKDLIEHSKQDKVLEPEKLDIISTLGLLLINPTSLPSTNQALDIQNQKFREVTINFEKFAEQDKDNFVTLFFKRFMPCPIFFTTFKEYFISKLMIPAYFLVNQSKDVENLINQIKTNQKQINIHAIPSSFYDDYKFVTEFKNPILGAYGITYEKMNEFNRLTMDDLYKIIKTEFAKPYLPDIINSFCILQTSEIDEICSYMYKKWEGPKGYCFSFLMQMCKKNESFRAYLCTNIMKIKESIVKHFRYNFGGYDQFYQWLQEMKNCSDFQQFLKDIDTIAIEEYAKLQPRDNSPEEAVVADFEKDFVTDVIELVESYMTS